MEDPLPQKTLMATVKAMKTDSMALFLHGSNPSNLKLSTRMVTEAIYETKNQ